MTGAQGGRRDRGKAEERQRRSRGEEGERSARREERQRKGRGEEGERSAIKGITCGRSDLYGVLVTVRLRALGSLYRTCWEPWPRSI